MRMLHLNTVSNMLNGCADRFDRDQKASQHGAVSGVSQTSDGP
jgi:hypothetical protein